MEQERGSYFFENTAIDPDNRLDASIRTGSQALLYAALQKPLEGAAQLINYLAHSEVISEPRIAAPPLQTEFGSSEWVVQQMGYGVGITCDLALLRGVGKLKPFSTGGAYVASTLEKNGIGWMNNRASRAFVGGFLFEGIGQSVHPDEMDNFWNARMRNGLNGGVALSSARLMADGMEKLGQRPAPGDYWPEKNKFGRIDVALRRIPSGIVSAGAAGVLAAETQSLYSNHRFATTEELERSASAYALGSIYPAIFSGRAQPMIMPALEKTGLNVAAETFKLKELTIAGGIDKQSVPLMNVFDARASLRGLNEQELARSYHNISRIFKDNQSPDSHLTPELRKQVGLEVLHHAAFPTSIDQGQNYTCIVTASESSMFTTNPASATRVISDLALTGQFRAHGGNIIRPNRDDLKPDAEAQAFKFDQIGHGSRTYASQLYQVGSVDLHWQRAELTGDDPRYKAGTLHYRIQPKTEGFRNEERVSYIDPKTKAEERIFKDDEGPGMDADKIISIERQISGKLMSQRAVSARDSGKSNKFRLHWTTVEQLRSGLEDLHKNKKFPVLVDVNTRAGEFWNVSRGNQPIMVSDEHLGTLSHSIQITSYSPETGRVTLDNTWGNDHDFTGRPRELKSLSTDELFEIMQAHPKNTEILMLSDNKKLTDDAMQHARRFSDLKQAYLGGTEIGDEGVSALKSSTKLNTLELSKTRVTDASADTVSNFRELTRLDLGQTKIGDATAKKLAELKHLQWLDLSGTAVTDNGLSVLGQMKDLKQLALSGTKITDSVVPTIEKLTKLERLTIACPGVSSDTILRMTNALPKLTYVTLDIASMNPETLSDWRKKLPKRCTSEFEDAIDKSRIDIVEYTTERKNIAVRSSDSKQPLSLKFTEQFRNLDGLAVSGGSLLPEARTRIAAMPELKTLTLDSVDVPDAGWKQLLGSPKLEQLKVSSRTLRSEFFIEVGRHAKLKGLQLRDAAFTDADAAKLSGATGLESVKLADCAGPGTKTLDTLFALPNLKDITLEAMPIKDKDVANLSKARSLVTFSADCCRLGDGTAALLPSDGHLSTVRMRRAELTDAGLKDLARIKTIRELDISETKVTDAGVAELALLSDLTTLDLHFTKVTDASMFVFKGLSKLERLDLEGTNITAVGVQQLKTMGSLRRLTLSRSVVSKDLEKELKQAMPKCQITVSGWVPVGPFELVK